MALKEEVLSRLGLPDLFKIIPNGKVDFQGWNSSDPLLIDPLKTLENPIVVEVGVWKGASTLLLAEEMRSSNKNGIIIAIDTFLGSSEHYISGKHSSVVGISNSGGLNLLQIFLANARQRNLEDFIIPVPLDSQSACELLSRRGIEASLIHLDAGHHYMSLSMDLVSWWKILRPNGVMVCDDYTDEIWPSVVRAVDDFRAHMNVEGFKENGVKCSFQKSQIDNHSLGTQANVGDSEVVNVHNLSSLEITNLQLENKLLSTELRNLDYRLTQINQSLSWQITEPLRKILSGINRIIRR
jgi:hypothetical protein